MDGRIVIKFHAGGKEVKVESELKGSSQADVLRVSVVLHSIADKLVKDLMKKLGYEMPETYKDSPDNISS